jgi:hypothetical protein
MPVAVFAVTHKTPAIRDWLAPPIPASTCTSRPPDIVLDQPGRTLVRAADRTDSSGRVHQSVVALENDVRQWINNWIRGPKPFIWTKTTEDILQSLSKYIAKVSGSGHSPTPYGSRSRCLITPA